MAVFASSDLKKWREKLGVSMADLAELVSCDASTIYKYECGKVKLNPDVMYQICEALGDVNVWCDWMRTEHPASYGRVHPDAMAMPVPGAMMRMFAEIQDVLDLQREAMRDAADGEIDDKKLEAEVIQQVEEAIAAGQRFLNVIRQRKRARKCK